MLVSLSRQDLTNYIGLFRCEPINEESIGLCADFPSHILPSAVEINDRVMGVTDNPFEMIDSVFRRGAEFCVYLEEDIVLADDAINLCNWYFNLQNVNDYLCLNLYNHNSNEFADNPEYNNVVGLDTNFSCLGVGITRYQWYTYFKPNFKSSTYGWDFAMTNVIYEKQLKVLKPAVSRSRHIGFWGGVHYRPAVHDPIYKNNKLYSGPKQTEFTIQNINNSFKLIGV
jgi:hypothetical protein